MLISLFTLFFGTPCMLEGIKTILNKNSFFESKYTKCPQKKCELLLVVVAIIQTFFWDTLYILNILLSLISKTMHYITCNFHTLVKFW